MALREEMKEGCGACAVWGCEDVDSLRFWWGLFFGVFGLHQTRNVEGHCADRAYSSTQGNTSSEGGYSILSSRKGLS
jgi:hypothetical protein